MKPARDTRAHVASTAPAMSMAPSAAAAPSPPSPPPSVLALARTSRTSSVNSLPRSAPSCSAERVYEKQPSRMPRRRVLRPESTGRRERRTCVCACRAQRPWAGGRG
eukprot:22633-Chlamydomonas_euryale.AAC.1